MPGQSGNPAGRPPHGKRLTEYLREALDVESPLGSGKTRGEALISVLLMIALQGDRQAIKDIFDRIDGRVPDVEPPTPESEREPIDIIGILESRLGPIPCGRRPGPAGPAPPPEPE